MDIITYALAKKYTDKSGGGGGGDTLQGKALELTSVLTNLKGTVKAGNLTEARTYTLPNKSGTIALTADIKNPANYSADEVVVGTWIDGKPLYQKTISYSDSDFNKTSNYIWAAPSFVSALDNPDTLVNVVGLIECLWTQYNTKLYIPLGGDLYIADDTDNFIKFCTYYASPALKTPLNWSFLSGLTVEKCQITVQYTKTTD